MQSENPILVNIISLGCAKNLVDSEIICGTLASNGICLVDDMEDADAVVINTCGFIHDARMEAERAIKKALAWKSAGLKQGYLRMVAVGGCLPQKEPENCLKKFKDVDAFFGLDAITEVWKIINDFFSLGQTKCRDCIKRELPTYLYDHTTPRLPGTPLPYAYVKIAEGCNHRCAFCAIPNIRGNLRSRTPDSILQECQQLLDMGFTELDFIAQDSTAYGMDRKDSFNLSQLIKRCDKELKGDFWIRILYTHPAHITDELLQLMASKESRVLPYLDVPLQHIADHILNDMKRRFSENDTRALVTKIRRQYPEISIRTTFLLGFPGETDEDFENLIDFVKETKFDRLGAFAFSPEINTPAAEITEGKVPASIANRRRARLMAVQREISVANNKKLVGMEQKVIIDSQIGKFEFNCRLMSDAPEVDQCVLLKLPVSRRISLKEGQFITIKITGADAYTLKATLP